MKRVLLLLAFLTPFILFSQIDSLKNALKNSALDDKKRVKLYIEISAAYWSIQLDSSQIYADKAYTLATQLNSTADIAHALLRKAMLLSNDDQHEPAMIELKNALRICKNHDLNPLAAEIYKNMGQACKNAPDSALMYYNKSIKIAEKLGDNDLVLKNKIRISLIYLHQKRHQELADLYDSILPELEKSNDIEGLIETYTFMALAFRDLNKKEKSLYYAERALSLSNSLPNNKLKSFVYGAIGSGIISYFETFEKAFPLVNKSIQLAQELNDRALLKNNSKRLALLYYNNGNYKKSALIIDSLLQQSTADPDVFKFKGLLLYEAKKYNEANSYYDMAYQLYTKDKALIQQKLILQLKIDSKIDHIGNTDLMNDFLLLDSLTNVIHDSESKNHFFNLETKYRTAEKEAKIQEKELELTKSKNRIILISAIAIIGIGASLFGFWHLRSRQKRKELEHNNVILQLQNNLNSSELATLNNQLNPHEIKNLIAGIAPELVTKAPEAYKKMIRLFNVTRASLSNQMTESLAIQVQQAEDYLFLQQSISPYTWLFDIDNQAEGIEIQLPRLMLKNLVENAVKYGMKSIKSLGEISVIISKDKHLLKIQVMDNGMEFGQPTATESTGIGLSTYQKLFNYANKLNDHKASLRVYRDGQWTTSEILLPLNYNYPN